MWSGSGRAVPWLEVGGFQGAGREADTVLPADLDSHQELSSVVVRGNQKQVGALSGRL